MKNVVILCLLFISGWLPAQDGINYDESKVPQYVLPDVLTLSNGQKMETTEQWEKQRRPELLEIFASQTYGRTPTEKINVKFENNITDDC